MELIYIKKKTTTFLFYKRMKLREVLETEKRGEKYIEKVCGFRVLSHTDRRGAF